MYVGFNSLHIFHRYLSVKDHIQFHLQISPGNLDLVLPFEAVDCLKFFQGFYELLHHGPRTEFQRHGLCGVLSVTEAR